MIHYLASGNEVGLGVDSVELFDIETMQLSDKGVVLEELSSPQSPTVVTFIPPPGMLKR